MGSNSDNLLEEEKCLIFNEFRHFDEVIELIKSIPKSTETPGGEEFLDEHLSKIFNFYQEQPHLLDPYLERLISECLSITRSNVDKPRAFHFTFRVLYLMVKTRGYKSIIQLMPHTVDDIEPTLNLLIAQDISDSETWETRYVLLLWLSILAMIPFGLQTLSAIDDIPIVDRILAQSKRYLSLDVRTQEAASFLLTRLVTRPDVVTIHLSPMVDWCLERISLIDYSTGSGQNSVCGVLRALANICKIGRRGELAQCAPRILAALLQISSDVNKGHLVSRLETKLLQRVGLIFCPPRCTISWQYQRGSRSLADNLATRAKDVPLNPSTNGVTCETKAINGNRVHVPDESPAMEEDDSELVHAEEVADVIERLIQALRNQYTVVRWSAAKGLGRICSRLSSSMVDDVLSAILVLCTRLEPFNAWHGACLALAELGRRSLLLPSKLPEVIPVIHRALFYDERSGDHSYGANVRDAACYVCWAFARAYRAIDLVPYVDQVANALVLASLFDREVNVRRAASAAFQENVGRQGQFPHGIDILTTCDYFALRNLKNCFLELSVYVSQFHQYTQSMIDHVATQLLSHWDATIRFLAARALHVLCPASPDYMKQTILPQLIERSSEAALYSKQGNIFGLGEVILALKDSPLDSKCLTGIETIITKLTERHQLSGISGELLRKAVCHLIEQSSKANLPLHERPVIDVWRVFLDECIGHKEAAVQNAAKSAYPAFLQTYSYTSGGKLRSEFRDAMLKHILAELDASSSVKLAGYLHVLSKAPSDLFTGHVTRVISLVCTACQITPRTRTWGEARQDGLQALVGICDQLGAKNVELTDDALEKVSHTLLASLSDYTVDSRGDIGSRVREVGMECLQRYLSFLTVGQLTAVLKPELVVDALSGVVKQAVEKIDRTRGVAGNVFAAVLHHDPPIPYIPHANALKSIFPKEACDAMLWRSAQQTFPCFVKLLNLVDFQYSVLLGLTASVGGLTEDTVLCSTDAITEFLIHQESDENFIRTFFVTLERVCKTCCQDERLILALLKFLDFLFNNAIICSTLTEDDRPILMRLVDNTWSNIKSTRDVHRIKAAIDVFGAMVQFEGPVRARVIHLSLILLGHRYPVVRKSAATKLYECLLVYELTEPDAMDKISALLTETTWELDQSTVRPIRDEVCKLMGSPVPVLTKTVNGQAGDTGGP